MKKHTYGFTIVELLIVIVVIAILAAISVTAYTGIQGRARDSQRIQDIQTIQKALELYKTAQGSYPVAVGTAGAGGFELSSSGTFLSVLSSSNTISSIPLDPINEYDGESIGRWSNSRVYFYYRYPAGYSGADASCGPFYILGTTRLDTITQGQSHPNSPGFTAPERSWDSTGAYVTGRYTNC